MGAFVIVRRQGEHAHDGDNCARSIILEIYEAMQVVARSVWAYRPASTLYRPTHAAATRRAARPRLLIP